MNSQSVSDATNTPANTVNATRIQFISPPPPIPVAILVVNALESELECDKSRAKFNEAATRGSIAVINKGGEETL